eukprot:6204772-Pleurochrysis_carterae.AAC.2
MALRMSVAQRADEILEMMRRRLQRSERARARRVHPINRCACFLLSLLLSFSYSLTHSSSTSSSYIVALDVLAVRVLNFLSRSFSIWISLSRSLHLLLLLSLSPSHPTYLLPGLSPNGRRAAARQLSRSQFQQHAPGLSARVYSSSPLSPLRRLPLVRASQPGVAMRGTDVKELERARDQVTFAPPLSLARDALAR